MLNRAPHANLTDQGDDVARWRRRCLERAGFDARLARALAHDRRYDLHAALDLVDRGCPPGLAARILAPFDEPLPDGHGPGRS